MSKLSNQLAVKLGDITPPSAKYNQGSINNETALKNGETIISNIIGVLTILGGIFYVVYFVVACIEWINAGGDSGKAQKARDKMIQGAIGLIIIVAAYGVIGLIGTIIGVELLRPAKMIKELVTG
ncbi:MAG: hypothetical protein ACOZAN_01495 [Patescibacteria group bacterium]